MRTASQENSEKITLPLLFMLTRRMILFLFLLMAVMLLFYIIGNYQLFLDSSQQIILKVAAITSSVQIFMSLIGIAESVLCLVFIKDRRPYHIFHLILIILAGLFSAAFLILFRFIYIASGGMQA